MTTRNVIGNCPICSEELQVTRLECTTCGTRLEGHFSLGPWFNLNEEQLKFLESFLRNQGKITWVAEDLGQSYPTVRSRLHEILLTLNLPPRRDSGQVHEAGANEQRQSILNELAAAQITVQQAADLLQNVSDS